MRVSLVRAVIIALVSLILLTRQVSAAGVVGNGTSGSCTEAALDQALKNGGYISFNCGGSPVKITVSSTKVITLPTTIDGGNLVTLSGGWSRPIIYNQSSLLTVRNLTFAEGYYSLPSNITGGPYVDGGGAIRGGWKASLTVENCKFYNNAVKSQSVTNDNGGGALFVHTGTLTVSNSEFKYNRADNSSGGAIHTLWANVTITNTTFESNSATEYGGAYYNDGVLGAGGFIKFSGTKINNSNARGQGGGAFHFLYPSQPGSYVSITSGEYRNNKVMPDGRGDAYGGAVRHGNGPLYLSGTKFVDNVAQKQGGALWTGEAASVNLSNIVMTDNQVWERSGSGLGGAIFNNNSGAFSVNGAKLVHNYAGYLGGAIWGNNAGVTFANTIFYYNWSGNPWGIDQHCRGPYANGGGNVQWPKSASDHGCTPGIAIYDPQLPSQR